MQNKEASYSSPGEKEWWPELSWLLRAGRETDLGSSWSVRPCVLPPERL